jgi:hypothetical protein
MSWLVILRPTRDDTADPAVASGAMTAEIRPFRISVR